MRPVLYTAFQTDTMESLLIKSQGENEVNFRTDFEYNK